MSRAIPILRVGNNLLVSVQSDLGDSVAERFQIDVLEAIEAHGVPGLILDITGLEIVDTYVARVLADTAQMASLMGSTTVVVGMRPEVAATLVAMDYPLSGLHTALNIDDGIVRLADLAAEREAR